MLISKRKHILIFMKKIKTIGLILLERMDSYGLRSVHGIADYAALKGDWHLFAKPEVAGMSKLTPEFKPDGLIVHASQQSKIKEAQCFNCPVVNISSSLAEVPFPSVVPDNNAIGKAAFDFFYGKGYKNYAFFGSFETSSFCGDRRNTFRKLCLENEFTYMENHFPNDISGEEDSLRVPLLNLPKPAAIFCVNDILAASVIECCIQNKILVPDEVSVLGVNNLTLCCCCRQPTISSICPNHRQVGFEAARMLDEIISEKQPEHTVLKIPPRTIVERNSTGLVAIEDPEVAAAFSFVRDYASEGISVQDIVDHVNISRRSLERRFREIIGRSPAEEINRMRVLRIKNYLQNTTLSMKDIAAKTGFVDAKYLGKFFRKHEGRTLTDFRYGSWRFNLPEEDIWVLS